IMVPLEGPVTGGRVVLDKPDASSMDAVTRGTLDGAALLISILAMLLVLVSLVTLVNLGFALLPLVQGEPLSAQRMLGWVLAPVAGLAGVQWSEAYVAGSLLGTKTVLNELVAYIDLANLSAAELSPRSKLLMTYALCGFANLGSLGILIGGLATMAPERRDEVVALGFKSIVAGTLATCMTGAIVGMFWTD
ncbi:MAG: nucleoside:proton symporter, partial [Betaproteobacteria bacterium]